MPRMNNAGSTTASKVAEKIAKNKTSTTSGTSSKNTSSFTSGGGASVLVPGGLKELTPDNVGSMMPKYEPGQFHHSDPLNPNAGSPQATKEQHTQGMAIYEGNQRALDLIGGAMDVANKNFTVMGKQAKAVSAGVKAATAIEGTKGDVLDYLKQRETTAQKGIDYGIATYTTQVNQQVAVHTQTELNEKLAQATIKAEDAQLKTVEKQQALNSFKAQLGQYLPQGA